MDFEVEFSLVDMVFLGYRQLLESLTEATFTWKGTLKLMRQDQCPLVVGAFADLLCFFC